MSGSSGSGLIKGRITDEDVGRMRARIGYPNPTTRKGYWSWPWHPTADGESIRRFALCTGDDNPLYIDPDHAAGSRWGTSVAPAGFEWSMGWDNSRAVPDDLLAATKGALRGVQLYHSGAEYVFHRPITAETELFKAEWLSGVEEKTGRFAAKSVLATNSNCFWDKDDNVYVTSDRWFVHAERKQLSDAENAEKKAAEQEAGKKKPSYEPPVYTDEQLAEIEAAYDAQYQRGTDTLYLEDVKVGDPLPVMVKGPFTITDMINAHMAIGWVTYGSPPFRLAYESRKAMRGFYTRNEFNAWDTLQRVHWDPSLARGVGVPNVYDIGPMRYIWICHYLTAFAGDDAWVYRLRYELRNFNYVGDTSWISGEVTDVRVDEALGPMVEVKVKAVNQRGQENIVASATILVASRERGAVRLPEAPAVTPYRADNPYKRA